MEGDEQKICPNCKREIPAVNFTIHTVHCARNIRVCPVCKEPVPQAELEEHHEKLHKLLPCKECGEKVCGTDLEDHIRDSCAHTIKSCRFCELELPRRELPAHEGYCGVRTEQCPECREWVMIKYRQLHVESNHGFLRLDDDPVPQPKKEPIRAAAKLTNLPKPTNISLPSTSNGVPANFQFPTNFNQPPTNFNQLPTNLHQPTNFVKNTNLLQNRPRTEIRYYNSTDSGPSTSSSSSSLENQAASAARPFPVFNGVSSKMPLKRMNDQPQINTTVTAANKVDKDLAISRGAVKKRPAPKPPTREPPTVDPKREMAYQSALQRHQKEERDRQEQNAYNLAHGLPPVLTPAAKVDKLRKMDALQNREVEDTDYKNRLQGRVWMDRSNVPAGNVLGSSSGQDASHLGAERRRDKVNRPVVTFEDDQRVDLKDIKPMTPEQFMDRFQELQLRRDGEDGENSARRADRFSEIKSSLRELRRGLNEVTAPYNSNNSTANNNGERVRMPPPRRSPSPRLSAAPSDHEPVHLPCEFCGRPVPADQLVLHQTGCRPDLAQFRAGGSRGASPRPAPGEPVIPCEFCTESLPVYLINEHQERCGREANLLYAD